MRSRRVIVGLLAIFSVPLLSLGLLVATPELADAATARKVTLSVSKVSVNPGESFTIKAKVSGFAGKPVVRLQDLRGKRWVTFKRLKQTSASQFRVSLKRNNAGALRFRAIVEERRAGKSTLKRISAAKAVRVRNTSTVTVSQSATETTGERVVLEGKVLPVNANAKLVLQRKNGSSWVEVAKASQRPGGYFTFRVWPGEGDTVFRVVREAQPRTTRVQSSWIGIRGTKPSVCSQPLAGTAALRAELQDRLSESAERPVVIVGAGSSTTFGSGATQESNRWINRFATRLSTEFDLSGTAPAPVLRQGTLGWSEPRENAGIHVVNVALGGGRADTYLFGGSPVKRIESVVALNPDVVVHFVGSNDYRQARDPQSYADDLRRTVEYIDANVTGEQPLHIFVHAYRPLRPTGLPIPWTSYRSAVSQVVAEDRGQRVLVDLSGWFSRAGTAATDPWGFIRDGVHPTDAGHQQLDGLISRALDLNTAC